MKFNDYLRQIVVGSFTLWANPVDLSAETRSESELIRKLMETPVKAEKDIEKKDRKSEKQKRISYKTNDFSEDSEKVLLARMIFGEGRNCSYDEQIAIGFTSFERANDGKNGMEKLSGRLFFALLNILVSIKMILIMKK